MSNKLSSALVADMPKRGRDRPLHAPLYWSVALRPSPPACRKGEGRERGVGAIAAALTTACSTHPASHRQPASATAAPLAARPALPVGRSKPFATRLPKRGRERESGSDCCRSDHRPLHPPCFAPLACSGHRRPLSRERSSPPTPPFCSASWLDPPACFSRYLPLRCHFACKGIERREEF